MTSLFKVRGTLKKEGRAYVLSPLTEVEWEPESEKVYIISIALDKGSRTLSQNDLMWWTYRKEAQLLNGGQVGPEAVTPEELYVRDIVTYTDAVVAFVVPEALPELKAHYKEVIVTGERVINGKVYKACQCWTGSSLWDKAKMASFIDFRFRRLHEYGYDPEVDLMHKQWRER